MPGLKTASRILSWVLLLALVACASPGSVQTPADLPFVTATHNADVPPLPAATATPTPAPTRTPTPPPEQRTRYTLSAVLDYWGHLLTVEQQIEYTNNSPDELTELVLMVEPLYFSGVFNLTSLSWLDGQAITPTVEGQTLHLPLPAPLQPGERIGISLAYQLRLPSPVPDPGIRPIPFGYTDRQTNLVDWYPFIPPYLPGQGWLVNPASYYGEHLAYEIADFDVRIRLEASGTPLTIAASSVATQKDEWYVYQHKAARNFAWSVSHQYEMQTVQAGDVTVTSYYFPIHLKGGEAALQTTAQAVELYSRLFGPYPHRTLSVVEADFLDGMEYDGLYFLSNGFYNLYTGTPGEYLIAIAAHETAHQWFYGLVGNDQANEPWLDEALCTYSERLYYENFHPEALDWWWAYRINYYNPQGWVDTNIYNPQGVAQAYSAYRSAVYFNGAVFLEELRQTIGDSTFLPFVKEYVRTNTQKLVTGQSFFSLLAQATSIDVTPILEKYFSPLYRSNY